MGGGTSDDRPEGDRIRLTTEQIFALMQGREVAVQVGPGEELTLESGVAGPEEER